MTSEEYDERLYLQQHNRHHAQQQQHLSLRASCPALPANSPNKQGGWSYSYSPPSLKTHSTSLSTSFSTSNASLRYLTDFEELKGVGKGSFGTVVKVKNRLDERDYAVKKIRLSRRNDSSFNKKILREVSTLSRVSHENVVRYYQAWIEDGPPHDDSVKDTEEEEESSLFGSTSNRHVSGDDEEEEEEEEEVDFMDDSSDEDETHMDDSLEDVVASPVFEEEDVNCDPAIFSSHFDLPKGRHMSSRRGVGKNNKHHLKQNSMQKMLVKKKKKRMRTEEQSTNNLQQEQHPMDDESYSCYCNLCLAGYRDWEVMFSDWKDKMVSLQPINVCQRCYASQLRSAGVDTSTLSMTLKPELKRVQYLYIQMEYCHFSLREMITNKKIWNRTEDELWRLFRQIVEGLDHIHTQGIIHRDLKPDNVFITIDHHNELKTKIGDFGLATSISETASKNGAQRRGGEMTSKVGTYLYSSPEMVSLSRSGYDEKVDIYALGIILFELWHPFATGMERCKVLEALRNNLTFPADFEKDPAYRDQVRLVRWMLQKDPKARPSAADLLATLPHSRSGSGAPTAKAESLPSPPEVTVNSRAHLLNTQRLSMTHIPTTELDPHSFERLHFQLSTQKSIIKSLETRCSDQQREIEHLRNQLTQLLKLNSPQPSPTKP